MDNSKIITTLAMLKAQSDMGFDYIEIFVPFIIHLIKINGYREIDINVIKSDFEREYGLVIPYYGIKTILRRCKTRGYIIQNNGQYFPNNEKIISDDFSFESNSQVLKINQLINDFEVYVQNQFASKTLSKDDCEKLLISFIRDHGSDILYSSENHSTIPEINVSKENYFIVSKYLEFLISSNSQLFEYLLDFSMGQSLADIIICEDFEKYSFNLSKLKCYLDAGIIFYLLGTDGEARQSVYQELIDALNKSGAKLFIFQHTYEEVSSILYSCAKWIDNPNFDYGRANRTMLFFIENGYHKSDAELFVAKLDTILKNNCIEVVEKPLYEIDSRFQIDEKALSDKMREIYQERSKNDRADLVNPETLERDIKSIYSIYKLRRGAQPKTLKDAGHIFITTAKSFAYAVSMFEGEFLDKFTIKSCITDEFISTIIWVHNPQKYIEINKKKIISDIYAALKPSKRLLKQYLHQISILRNDKSLSEEQYYILKGNKASMDLLSEKTLSDPDNFTSKTITDILIDEKEMARSEYLAEVDSHNKTKEEVIEKEKRISIIERNIRKISKYFSYIPASFITFVILLPILFSTPWIIKLSLVICSVLSIWGLGVTALRKRIEEKIAWFIQRVIGA